MVAIFRNHNPFAVIALFILTILCRVAFMNSGGEPLVKEGQYMWQYLLNAWKATMGYAPFVMYVFLILNIFAQGLVLNRIASTYSLFPKLSYLPAFNYVLLSALLLEWNQWSVFVLINWVLLFLLKTILKLYLIKDATKEMLNIGILCACIAILYFPAIVLIALALIGIASLRTFIPREWLAFLVGLLIPYYLFVAICYLTDHLHLCAYLLQFDIDLIKHYSAKHIAALSLLAILLIVGLFYTNSFVSRMVIEGKKYWNVIGAYLVLTFVAFFATMNDSYAGLSMMIAPLALVSTYVYFEPYKKWIPTLVSFLLIAMVGWIQWM